MDAQQSEIEELREAVHSLAEALQPKLLENIFQGKGAGFNSPEYKKFRQLVEDALGKSSNPALRRS
jgi:hypothetical protein